jgi:hypothetical protein
VSEIRRRSKGEENGLEAAVERKTDNMHLQSVLDKF